MPPPSMPPPSMPPPATVSPYSPPAGYNMGYPNPTPIPVQAAPVNPLPTMAPPTAQPNVYYNSPPAW